MRETESERWEKRGEESSRRRSPLSGELFLRLVREREVCLAERRKKKSLPQKFESQACLLPLQKKTSAEQVLQAAGAGEGV